ncbi:MAG: hypothetical protein ACLR9W_04955 [Enterobacter hormaechei]
MALVQNDVALYRAFSAGCRGGGLLPASYSRDLVDRFRYRARIIASFMVAIRCIYWLAAVRLILSLDGWLGLRGWHLLFIIEGLPAVLLGIAEVCSSRSSAQANWLTRNRKMAETTLETERQQQNIGHQTTWRLLRHRQNLAAGADLPGASSAGTTISVWSPQLLKSFPG